MRLLRVGGVTAALLLVAASCSSGGQKAVSASRSTTTTQAVADTTSTTTTSTTAAPVTTAVNPAVVDKIALRKMATLTKPIAFAIRAGDPSVYIAQQGGLVKRLTVSGNTATVGATVLDISSQVSTGNEQGLLGIAFSPDGTKLYADYTNTTGVGNTVVSEFPFTTGTAGAERVVIGVDQPYANHNGGNIVFGPDEMLYIALGDGGSGGDPQHNGQNLNTLLGKILRINPAKSGTQPYTIPAGNPFVGQSSTRGEIWHYGLRNPWRFSFDAANGEMWIGDVGQDAWEEIDHVSAGAKGVNFGWGNREGKHPYNGGAMPPGAVDPVFELSHNDGNEAVTGGYVYRGAAIRGLAGTYLFDDVYKQVLVGASGTTMRSMGITIPHGVSFGQDQSNELWALSLDGPVYKLVRG